MYDLIHNPIILTDLDLENIIYDNVIAISYSAEGAMGNPGQITFFTNDKGEIKYYIADYYYGYKGKKVTLEKVLNIFPILKESNITNEYLREAKEFNNDWIHIFLGFGNHLFIKNMMYNDFIKHYKDSELVDIYNSWKLFVIVFYKDFIKWGN